MGKYMISVIDYLQDTIFEQAFQRKTLKNKISNLQEQPIINLIKIAIFGMESTWKTEFITVIKHIEQFKLKNSKTKKLSKDQYFKLLFREPLEPLDPWNESDLYTYINGHEILDNENYKKLHHIEINENNLKLIYDMIKKIMSEISELLSKNISLHNKLDKSLNDYIEFWTKKY